MELTAEILDLRPYLFRIAYNMLGAVQEAEDIVHDAFEKWIFAQNVKEPKTYLGRVAANQSIKRLEELKKQRETYKGPWLPEPIITMEPETTPTIEYGLLFLLERLNPVERAVFILRESFSEEYTSIAEITGLTAENCRQVFHRGREKLGRKVSHPIDPLKQKAITEAFIFAVYQQDRHVLDELLKSDIELYSDGGGKRQAALRPLFEIEPVLRFLLGVVKLTQSQHIEFEYRPAYVNGLPAALIYERATGELDSMNYLQQDEDGIYRLLYVRNPDKLKIR